MNAFVPGQEAQLVYGANDLRVVVDGQILPYDPGRFDGWFVRCAVTQKPIALAELRYWNVDEQEAYADADAALARWKQLNGG